MFIPVIRCEEEDLYVIVVECIQAASARLFRKHLPPPEARCNPSSHRGDAGAFSQLLISLIKGSSLSSDTTRGNISSIQ